VKTNKELLDKWWNTEPFGFDHPDTYNGILDRMDKVKETTLKEVREIIQDFYDCEGRPFDLETRIKNLSDKRG